MNGSFPYRTAKDLPVSPPNRGGHIRPVGRSHARLHVSNYGQLRKKNQQRGTRYREVNSLPIAAQATLSETKNSPPRNDHTGLPTTDSRYVWTRLPRVVGSIAAELAFATLIAADLASVTLSRRYRHSNSPGRRHRRIRPPRFPRKSRSKWPKPHKPLRRHAGNRLHYCGRGRQFPGLLAAINFVLTNGGSMRDHWGWGRPPPLLPMIAIPTTAGTGSEAQTYALISEMPPLIRRWRRSRAAFRVALLDPVLCVTAPQSVRAAAGYDATSRRRDLGDYR